MCEGRLQIGSVPYLNAKPLFVPLARRDDVEMTLLPPRDLAAHLAAGRIEAGLVPTFDFLMRSDHRAARGVAIASRGPVRSVLFFHRVPLDRVRRVAVDRSSLSSSALLKILLAERFRLAPDYADTAPDLRALERGADGLLLIGDPAMRAAAESRVPRLDLGEEWTRHTGLPFVYAVFALRPGAREEAITRAIGEAKTAGLSERDEIADSSAAGLGLPAAELRTYLSECIRYDLGEEEIAGMEAFRDAAGRCGLLPERRPIALVGSALPAGVRPS